MKRGAILVLMLSAGVPALAQEVMVVSYTWTEVVAGTNVPVANPNGFLEPGEAARIEIGLTLLMNGQNAVGQTTTFTGLPPNFGTIRGIESFLYSLAGTGGSATGSWSGQSFSPILPIAHTMGLSANGGARLQTFGAGQWPVPPASVIGTNPITGAWRGVWTPSSFAPRVVTFKAEPSPAALPGQASAIGIQFGTSYLDPSDPTTEYPEYWVKYVTTDFGTGVAIPLRYTDTSCYANCDGSTAAPLLNANDFQCFLGKFVASDSYANCDQSTVEPVLNVSDFQCFLTKFSAGCA